MITTILVHCALAASFEMTLLCTMNHFELVPRYELLSPTPCGSIVSGTPWHQLLYSFCVLRPRRCAPSPSPSFSWYVLPFCSFAVSPCARGWFCKCCLLFCTSLLLTKTFSLLYMSCPLPFNVGLNDDKQQSNIWWSRLCLLNTLMMNDHERASTWNVCEYQLLNLPRSNIDLVVQHVLWFRAHPYSRICHHFELLLFGEYRFLSFPGFCTESFFFPFRWLFTSSSGIQVKSGSIANLNISRWKYSTLSSTLSCPLTFLSAVSHLVAVERLLLRRLCSYSDLLVVTLFLPLGTLERASEKGRRASTKRTPNTGRQVRWRRWRPSSQMDCQTNRMDGLVAAWMDHAEACIIVWMVGARTVVATITGKFLWPCRSSASTGALCCSFLIIYFFLFPTCFSHHLVLAPTLELVLSTRNRSILNAFFLCAIVFPFPIWMAIFLCTLAMIRTTLASFGDILRRRTSPSFLAFHLLRVLSAFVWTTCFFSIVTFFLTLAEWSWSSSPGWSSPPPITNLVVIIGGHRSCYFQPSAVSFFDLVHVLLNQMPSISICASCLHFRALFWSFLFSFPPHVSLFII